MDVPSAYSSTTLTPVLILEKGFCALFEILSEMNQNFRNTITLDLLKNSMYVPTK